MEESMSSGRIFFSTYPVGFSLFSTSSSSEFESSSIFSSSSAFNFGKRFDKYFNPAFLTFPLLKTAYFLYEKLFYFFNNLPSKWPLINIFFLQLLLPYPE